MAKEVPKVQALDEARGVRVLQEEGSQGGLPQELPAVRARQRPLPVLRAHVGGD